MRRIYLSPHLDDAIFSAGGAIYEQSREEIPAEIWTIMSGYPEDIKLSDFAKRLHKRWGFSSAEESLDARREENERAASIVGAKTVYLDFLDSMYRSDPRGKVLYTNSFMAQHDADSDLPAKIAKAISERLTEEDILVSPIGFGGHIDHIVVRKAAELLSYPLLYCADVPYLLNNPRKLWRKTFGLKKLIQPVSKDGLMVWLQAILVYESQLKMEFTSREIMQEKISTYWKKFNGIRFWKSR